MDILGGAAICRGPRSPFGNAYAATPIGITVEGANILTRTLIIFGQGVTRCHPFVREELAAIAAGDRVRFDRAFLGHLGHVLRTLVRTPWLALTNGAWAAPSEAGGGSAHAGRLSRTSSAFALVSEACLVTLGGGLKREQKLTGRLADCLAWMYLGSSALKEFRDAGELAEDRPFLDWSLETAAYEAERSLVGVLDNFPSRPVAWILWLLCFPLGARRRPPSDALGGRVARGLLDGGAARVRHSDDVYLPPAGTPGLATLEAALGAAVAARPVHDRIRTAVRSGELARNPRGTQTARAAEAGLISAEDQALVEAADAARREAIAVDDYPVMDSEPGTQRRALG
jgi:acyl-CoA dehydrogenase